MLAPLPGLALTPAAPRPAPQAARTDVAAAAAGEAADSVALGAGAAAVPDVKLWARHAVSSAAEAAAAGMPGVPQVWRQGLCPYMSQAAQQQSGPDSALACLSQALQDRQLDPVEFFGQLRDQFGSQVQLGQVVVETRSEVAQAILNATDHRRSERSLFAKSPLQGHGLSSVYGDDSLFLLGGESWQERRQALSTHFRVETLLAPEKVSALKERVAGHLDRLEGLSREGPVDLNRFLRGVTLDVASHTMFGETLSAGELQSSVELFDRAGQEVAERQWFGESKRDTRAELACWAERRLQGRSAGDPTRSDLLQTVLDQHAGGAPPLQEVATMAMLGHETTANLLSWAVAELSSQPELRQQIRDERDAETQTATRGALREAARLHAPNFLLGREALTDIDLDTPQGRFSVPAGTQVLMPLQQVNADAREDDTTPTSKFYSFGGGARVCLGQVLARLEAQIVLSELTSRFELTPVSQQPLQPRSDVSSRPADSRFHVAPR